MVLAIRKKPLYQMAFMIPDAISSGAVGKGAGILLGFEEGLESQYESGIAELHGVTDLPGIDILFASTMLYYGLPIYLAVNVIDKGIGAIEFGSSLISKPSEAEKVAERQPEAAGLGV